MKILNYIGIIVLMIGVIFIYDARPITKKRFSFADRNEAALGFKIAGFILSVIGGMMLFI